MLQNMQKRSPYLYIYEATYVLLSYETLSPYSVFNSESTSEKSLFYEEKTAL